MKENLEREREGEREGGRESGRVGGREGGRERGRGKERRGLGQLCYKDNECDRVSEYSKVHDHKKPYKHSQIISISRHQSNRRGHDHAPLPRRTSHVTVATRTKFLFVFAHDVDLLHAELLVTE